MTAQPPPSVRSGFWARAQLGVRTARWLPALLVAIASLACATSTEPDPAPAVDAANANAQANAPADAETAHVEAMAREHEGEEPAATPATEPEPARSIATDEVTYARLDGTVIRGYLARPRTSDTAGAAEVGGAGKAGLLVIHEWWGLNDNVRAMTERFAGEGYTALAVDLYEGESATDRDGAMGLMRGTLERTERLEENLRQAATFLREKAGVSRIGSVGWCFGGGWSLRTALHLGSGLDAAVIYYGRVTSSAEELEPLTAPVLGHFGSLDRGIPLEGVEEFERALAALGKDATIHVYDGADHAFANPSGQRYDSDAAELAWSRTLEFFAEHLGDG